MFSYCICFVLMICSSFLRSPTDGVGNIVGKAKGGEQGTVAVLDLAKAFERVSLPVVWAWAKHFTRKILRVLCGYFEHQRRVQLEGCAAEPLTTITAILPGYKKFYDHDARLDGSRTRGPANHQEGGADGLSMPSQESDWTYQGAR